MSGSEALAASSAGTKRAAADTQPTMKVIVLVKAKGDAGAVVAAAGVDEESARQGAVSRLVQIYANRGHLIAKLDPLGLSRRERPRVLELSYFGLDEADLVKPRKPNGDLPDVAFLHLAPGSDAIDRGVDVGRPFKGQAPDLGAFESVKY